MDAGRIAFYLSEEDFGTAGCEPTVWFQEAERDWDVADDSMEFFR